MKDDKKKVNVKKEETKKELKVKKDSVELTDEKLSQVAGGAGVKYNVIDEIVK